jgi:hypothetical protein
MSPRTLLAALIVISTAAFVVGTAIERNDVHHETAAAKSGEAANHHAESGGKGGTAAESSSESAAHRATEGGGATAGTETHSEELKPLGVDIEAAPFVIVAALASLALAVAAWRRPRSVPLLVIVALAMLAFVVLDVREVLHQSDESRTGLAVLATAVAALHLGAAAVAATMASRAHQADPETPGPAATMGA